MNFSSRDIVALIQVEEIENQIKIKIESDEEALKKDNDLRRAGYNHFERYKALFEVNKK